MASSNTYPLPVTIEAITPAWLEAALRTRAPGVTVLHGDTHFGPPLRRSGRRADFFYSLPHLAPAMYEVSYPITGALDVPDRRAHERDLVGTCREAPIRCGIDALPHPASQCQARWMLKQVQHDADEMSRTPVKGH